MAISLPSPRKRAASSAEWPPAPNVQSISVAPGFGASACSTSSARTGTWSAAVGNALGNMFRAPFELAPVLAPPGAIPDLEVVVDTGDGDVALDPGLFEQARGQHDPSLLVEVARHSVREEVPLHHPRLPAERIELADAENLPLPLRLRVGVEAAVEAGRDDDAIAELLAEPRGQREAVLVVEGVLMLTEQHGPLRPTLPHQPPVRKATSGGDRGSPPPRRGAPPLGSRRPRASADATATMSSSTKPWRVIDCVPIRIAPAGSGPSAAGQPIAESRMLLSASRRAAIAPPPSARSRPRRDAS